MHSCMRYIKLRGIATHCINITRFTYEPYPSPFLDGDERIDLSQRRKIRAPLLFPTRNMRKAKQRCAPYFSCSVVLRPSLSQLHRDAWDRQNGVDSFISKDKHATYSSLNNVESEKFSLKLSTRSRNLFKLLLKMRNIIYSSFWNSRDKYIINILYYIFNISLFHILLINCNN